MAMAVLGRLLEGEIAWLGLSRTIRVAVRIGIVYTYARRLRWTRAADSGKK